MHSVSRKIFLTASLMVTITYFVPLWQIQLSAPQYPEGIGIYIWLDEINGVNPHDLDNLNNLNHYIGMQRIIPESIPELKIMPFIIAFFILSGIAVFFINNRKAVWIWTILFILTMAVGLIDFYMWEYDYGHNLDPKAAIKVPGMSYQPPLIGSKQLLNFVSTSLPALGGIIIFISIALGFVSLYLDSKKRLA
jgi:copper chaperone NosL